MIHQNLNIIAENKPVFSKVADPGVLVQIQFRLLNKVGSGQIQIPLKSDVSLNIY